MWASSSGRQFASVPALAISILVFLELFAFTASRLRIDAIGFLPLLN